MAIADKNGLRIVKGDRVKISNEIGTLTGTVVSAFWYEDSGWNIVINRDNPSANGLINTSDLGHNIPSSWKQGPSEKPSKHYDGGTVELIK